MDISNASETDDVLLSITTDDFESAEFHNMYDEDGVMKMESMEKVDIKAGQSASFSPGGMHIMLINNKKNLKAGDKVELILHFQNAGTKTIKCPVVNVQDKVE